MKNVLREELDTLQEAGLYRKMRVVSSAPGRTFSIDGKTYLNLSSNNYLGLAGHPDVAEAACTAARNYGTGGTSSRLVAGTLAAHRELETSLARLKGAEDALVFPSGYQTNVGLISTLVSDGDCVIMDRLNHASLWDGAKLSGARIFVYPHRDMNGLEKVLKRATTYRRRLVVTDSVFSMDGDLAPLPDIVSLAQQYGAWTMIDEAHATGVFGRNGGGLAEHFGLEGKIDVVMGTLSKAIGSQGAFVCGSAELIEFLVNRCRAFIYTTALSPVSVAAAREALFLVEREPGRRARLLELSRTLREKLHSAGFDTCGSESQIVPCVIGPLDATAALSGRLLERGIYAPPIRPPTVPEGACRLRFSLTADHTEEDIEKLLDRLQSKS